ncbi:MAG: hypothetical protein WAN86_21305, partial [Hyphomicrobiaceae bacterium]
MPINVEQIIADVQAEDRARRDEELARHHQANEKLQEIFLAFNESNARRRLRDEYDATVDRQPSGVGI